MTGTDTRLHRLIGGEPAAWLLRRARDRLEAGRPLTGTVTLSAATPDQRRAVERLTGRSARSGTSLSVSLAEVDRILRDSGAAPGGLAEAVTLLTGPLRDRNRERAEVAAAWAAAFAPLDAAIGGRDACLRTGDRGQRGNGKQQRHFVQFLHGSPLRGKKPQPRCVNTTFKVTITKSVNSLCHTSLHNQLGSGGSHVGQNLIPGVLLRVRDRALQRKIKGFAPASLLPR